MPEDLSAALPHVRRMLEAFRVPILECDGYEADDIIGTLARRADMMVSKLYMVTPDKDFGQLGDENTFLYRPIAFVRLRENHGHSGNPTGSWGNQAARRYVIRYSGADGRISVDNVPGVPGVGEKDGDETHRTIRTRWKTRSRTRGELVKAN